MERIKGKEPVSFLFSPTVFDDPAVKAVRRQFGAKGELAVVKLLCEIAVNGYYAEWSEEVRHRLIEALPGVSANLLEMIVRDLIKNGFFDKESFATSGILTSEELQRKFFMTDEHSQMLPHLLVDLSVYRRTLINSEKTAVSSEETKINSEETKKQGNNLLNNKDYGTTTEARP